jgi:hypothetical protein
MSDQQTTVHGPGQDDYLKQQTRHGAGHVEEFHQVEPAAEPEVPDRDLLNARRDGSPGPSQDDLDTRSEIAAALGRHVYPADRERLIDVATGNAARDRVISLLERLPAGEEFENVQAVSRALGLEVEPPEAPRG